MPAYDSIGSPLALYAGDEVTLWNAEAPVAGSASIAVSLAASARSPSKAQLSISLYFASAPADVVLVQGANDDNAADYVTLGAVSFQGNITPDYVEFETNFQFIRLLLQSQSAGGAITAKVRRSA